MLDFCLSKVIIFRKYINIIIGLYLIVDTNLDKEYTFTLAWKSCWEPMGYKFKDLWLGLYALPVYSSNPTSTWCCPKISFYLVYVMYCNWKWMSLVHLHHHSAPLTEPEACVNFILHCSTRANDLGRKEVRLERLTLTVQ